MEGESAAGEYVTEALSLGHFSQHCGRRDRVENQTRPREGCRTNNVTVLDQREIDDREHLDADNDVRRTERLQAAELTASRDVHQDPGDYDQVYCDDRES